MLAEVFSHPELLRRELDGDMTPRPDGGLAELLRVSRVYVRDIGLDTVLYVPRTLEPELLATITDQTDSGRAHLVVGDAGFGKSTLLWSLSSTLSDHTEVVPLVLPAPWIIQRGIETVGDLAVDAAEELATDGRRLVMLLDTVDLLLHEEASRQDLRLLLDRLGGADVGVVATSRPVEAGLIADDVDRVLELPGYDDRELDVAVASLGHRYCPSGDAAGLHGQIRQATARSLPVTQVCRPPLLLRVLFELAAPAAPGLAEMDVTTLYREY